MQQRKCPPLPLAYQMCFKIADSHGYLSKALYHPYNTIDRRSSYRIKYIKHGKALVSQETDAYFIRKRIGLSAQRGETKAPLLPCSSILAIENTSLLSP